MIALKSQLNKEIINHYHYRLKYRINSLKKIAFFQLSSADISEINSANLFTQINKINKWKFKDSIYFENIKYIF
jgi:hypothetical protein